MLTDPDDYDAIVQEGRAVRRLANHLRRRAHLHPADPDALSEEEEEQLEALEDWEP